MSRHTSASDQRGLLRRFLRARRGAAAVEFAFISPLLIILTFGIIEFILVAVEFNLVTEATRAGVRVMVIEPPLPADLSKITDSTSVICTSSAEPADVTCDQSADERDTADATFDTMMDEMRLVLTDLDYDEVRVVYDFADIDDTSGIMTPLVTVEIQNRQYVSFLIDGLFGDMFGITFASFDLPAFSSSRLMYSSPT